MKPIDPVDLSAYPPIVLRPDLADALGLTGATDFVFIGPGILCTGECERLVWHDEQVSDQQQP